MVCPFENFTFSIGEQSCAEANELYLPAHQYLLLCSSGDVQNTHTDIAEFISTEFKLSKIKITLR